MSKKPTKKTPAAKTPTKTPPKTPAERRSNQFVKRVRVLGIAAILLGGIVAIIASLLISGTDNSQTAFDQHKTGTAITVTGEYVCLPHKDTSGPQTDECAFGLKTDKGVYYALYFSDVASQVRDLAAGDRLKVTGPFEEKESIYQSIGTITVDTAEEQ